MMLKRFVWGAGVLAVAAVLLLPQVSHAQRRGFFGGGYRGGYGGGYGNWGYGGGGYGMPGYRGYYGSNLGYGLVGPGYSYGFGGPIYSGMNSLYGGPVYSGMNYWGSNYAVNPGVAQQYQSFYPPETGSQSAANEARVRVLVPDPSAKVLIDGNSTRQSGREREFVTEMQPGSTGTYHIQARWTENGQPREETRDVQVQPGRTQFVDFTRPQGGANPGGRQTSPPTKDGSPESPLP